MVARNGIYTDGFFWVKWSYRDKGPEKRYRTPLIIPFGIYRRRLLLGDENDENPTLDNAADDDGGMDEPPSAECHRVSYRVQFQFYPFATRGYCK